MHSCADAGLIRRRADREHPVVRSHVGLHPQHTGCAVMLHADDGGQQRQGRIVAEILPRDMSVFELTEFLIDLQHKDVG